MKAKWLNGLIGLALLAPVGVVANDHEDDEEWREREVTVEEALEFVGTHSPPIREALTELRRENPEEFEETIEDVTHLIHEYHEAKRERPQEAERMLKLEVGEAESEWVARQYHETDDPERRDRLRERLRGMLNELFELKQHAREKELHYLEREVMEVRERLERRAEHRERIIGRRMKDLLGAAEDDWMDW